MYICCPHRLFGSYEVLDGGELAEALEDFTGGVAEPITFAEIKVAEDEEARKVLFDMLKKEAGYKSLMAASIPVSTELCHLRNLKMPCQFYCFVCLVSGAFRKKPLYNDSRWKAHSLKRSNFKISILAL